MSKWIDATVSGRTNWTDQYISLRIAGHNPAFRAGQFIRVGLDVDGEVLARPYSLVSTPDEDELEIYFNIVPEGPLSPLLAGLQPGDAVKLAPSANGFLVLDEIPDSRDLWMMATGTGVGPFISILRTEEPWRRYRRVVLVYSVRHADELAYLDTLDEIAAQHADQFSLVPVVTRENVTGAIGKRITAALRDGELENRVGSEISAQDSHVMMCGNSEMIRDVFDVLEQRGMKKHLRRDPGHITTEKYH